MKNAIGMILAVVMAIACMCFVQAAAAEQMEAEVLGGWERPESPEITEEIQTLCGNAFEGMTGVSYTPVALLGTQVVAGTNYRILFRSTPAAPGAEETYAIGTLYEDLDGNVTLTDMQRSEIETGINGLEGSWVQSGSPVITKQVQHIFECAMDGLVGVDYQPIALLGSQVVAGTNYAVVCEATVISPDAASCYAIVYVNEALDGTAALLDIVIL